MKSKSAAHWACSWRKVLATLAGNAALVVLPIPIGPLRQRMVGNVRKDEDIEFYSHPDFVCTAHLIWVGWFVAAGGVYGELAARHGWWQFSQDLLGWMWILTIQLTVIVTGLKFNRVACGFLAAGTAILLLLMTVIELQIDLPLVRWVWQSLGHVPVVVPWGVPLATSSCLGLTFAGVATWQGLNARWRLPRFGNYLEHLNFQHRDRTIAKGAKNFVAIYPCLVRRYLLFGYGNIEVRSSTRDQLIDRIEGVFFAAHHAECIRQRFSATDVASQQAIEEEELDDEFAADAI